MILLPERLDEVMEMKTVLWTQRATANVLFKCWGHGSVAEHPMVESPEPNIHIYSKTDRGSGRTTREYTKTRWIPDLNW